MASDLPSGTDPEDHPAPDGGGPDVETVPDGAAPSPDPVEPEPAVEVWRSIWSEAMRAGFGPPEPSAGD